MHELITSVASVIILSLFVMQFALSENLFLELSACEKVISDYESTEIHDPIKLKTDLNNIPNVDADVSEDKVELIIDNIIVPMWNEGDNSIRVVRELRNEELVDNDGGDTSDELASEGID